MIREKDELRQAYELKMNSMFKDTSEEKKNLILAQNENVQRIAKYISENNRLDNEIKELQRRVTAAVASGEQTVTTKVNQMEHEIRELVTSRTELSSTIAKIN